MSLRLLYDISALGMGYATPAWRTGVFRVVEALGISLEGMDDCKLTLAAGESFNRLIETHGYMAEIGKFQRAELSESNGARLRGKVHRRLLHADRAVAGFDGGVRLNKTFWKAWRKLLFHLDRLLSRIGGGTIPERILAEADVYHSPFFPIPAQVERVKRLKKFLTVYDLNPILNPHLFVADNDQYLRALVKGIRPDHFTLCISHATKRDLCNFRRDLDPDRVSVTHLAASGAFYPCHDDAQKAAVRVKYGIPRDAPFVLSLATLSPHKNLSHLIRCFERLVEDQSFHELHLVLAGAKGWQGEQVVRDAAQSARVRDRILVTGYVADEDLAPLYADAVVFVYPSLYEGFGLPPLEAMQCGTPVITSNTSSLPEVVGSAGLMVSPTDEVALCEAMAAVYGSIDLRSRMARDSIEQAARFSWKRCADQTLSAYRAAVAA